MASNADQVFDFLVASGLKPGAAAGVVGNLQGESGADLQTNAVGDHGTSYGIAQWHAGRWTALKQFAAAHGWPVSGLDTQERFMVAELKDAGLWDQLRRLDNPDPAVALMVTQFERPADPQGAIARRTPLAHALLAKDAPNVWDAIKAGLSIPNPLDAASGVADGVGNAVSDAANSAAGAAVTAAEPLVVKSVFLLLGVGLVGTGVYLAARPKVQQVRQQTTQTAAAVAPLAAL